MNAAGSDAGAIAHAVCTFVVEHVTDGAIVTLFDGDRRTFVPVAIVDPSGGRSLHAHHGGSAWPQAASSASDARHETQGTPDVDVLLLGTTGRISIPLIVGGRSIGQLIAFRLAKHSRYTFREIDLLREVADRVAPVIDNARLHQALLARDRQVAELATHIMTLQEADRRRVAYDIHDGLAQIAASAYQHLEAFAEHYAHDPQERLELERTQALARRTIVEARRIIAQLRPTVLEDFGLIPALEDEIDALRRSGMDISFVNDSGNLRLPRMTEIALFRIAQEALANARKHAGPTPVHVSLAVVGARLRLDVQDRGRGFDSDAQMTRLGAGERVGLVGIRERAALLDGICEIRSRPGAGTRVTVEIPLPPVVEET